MDVPPNLYEAFDREEHELRLKQSKIAGILGILLFPAGVSLDAVSYPDKLQTLTLIRLLAALIIAVIVALHFIPRLAAQVRNLTMTGLLVAVTAISVMVALTDGALSSYYLGLFLILFAVGVLSPIEPIEAGAFCIATLTIYIAGCLSAPSSGVEIKVLLNNLYFLVLTSIISVTASHFHYRRRFNEFRLKYKLAQQHEKLSALDRLKSQFFANVSHELRTPLTLILAPVEKMKVDAGSLTKGARELLDIVENNALRLFRLVNDILSLVRLEEGRAELSMRPFDLQAFLKSTAASMRHLAEMKSITLTIDTGDEDLLIMADADAMEKIVHNVVGNAIKFTPAGGRVDITAVRDDRLVKVRITDTGIGIPNESLAHIFDRFYQVDGSATRRHQGLGLGLAMVRELVTRHNGEVVASSQQGNGTTFTITFPHVTQQVEDFIESKAPEGSDPVVVDPLRDFDRKATARALSAGEEVHDHETDAALDLKLANAPKILVVDDEPDMRRYLVTMLREDYRVIECADGSMVAGLVREVMPDLILLDVMLPGISGLEVCHALKEDPDFRRTKVVILTARADEEAKIVALRHGADDFLVKPFSGLEVRTRIANLLQSAELEQNLQRANQDLERSIRQLRETEAALVQNARLSALGTIAAGLLHEIGNPLNFMGTALQLAERDPLIIASEDTRETLGDIRDGYDRILRVVTDLRGFTAPQRPENPRPFDVTDAVTHALRFTAHARKGITVRQAIDEPSLAIGSQSTIAQVIVNLLLNAVAAVRSVENERKPEIIISTKVKDRQIVVSVRDNGVGIDPAIQAQIFDPFFSTKDVGEGMGLGLAVSHRIVQNHGGSLDVKSCLGKWTEFSFNLPRAISESANKVLHAVAS